MRSLLAGLMAVAIAASARAQQPAPAAFDAVSIKVNRSGEQGRSSRGQPGRYVGVNVTLMRLVRLAYRPVEEFDGGPDWKDKDHFDIEAVSSAGPSQPQMLAMMRTLLAERFKLRVHTETRALPVYELSLGRADGRLGPLLTRVADACPAPAAPAPPQPGPGPAIRCGFQVGDGLLKGMGTLANVASELVLTGRHAVDRTGLSGVYSIELRWSPDNVPGLPADAPPEIVTAVREQLGLRLQPATAPTEVVVIDSAERPEQD